MSQVPAPSPESLLHGASSMINAEAQRRIEAIGRAVARIDFADQDSGTGVLIGGRWLLTCHHVVPSFERARQVKAVIFGFERDHTDQLQAGVSVALAPDQGFHTHEADDWTLVRLAADARLAPFGHTSLFEDACAQPEAEARIVQHPGAREKSVATGTIVEADGERIRYRINTERGSSGAPVITREGKIIALHHAGGGDHNQGVAIQRVIAGIRALPDSPWQAISQPAPPFSQPLPQQLAPTRLVARHTAADFLGRDSELGLLDCAWQQQNGVVNLLSLIAWGGVGKTALLAHWVQSRFTARGWRNADGQPEPHAYFDWTFYDQGTRSAHSDDSQHAGAASLGAFFQTALKHFGDPDPNNPQDKVDRLARLIQSQRALLILDGLEPLQYPLNHPQAGQLTDPDLSELLGRLAQLNPGLCLISSRQPLSEFPASDTSPTREHPLEELPLEAAVALLEGAGVKGTEAELEQAANDYFCHALSLTVLARYLALNGGDIRRRDVIQLETASAERNQRITRNAWHVLEAYERWLASPEGNPADAQALRLAGLFDRPASPDCLDALREAPAIPGLTDALVPLSDSAWNAVLMRPHEAHLIQLRFPPDDPASWAPRPEPRQVPLDAHPLIREYFAKRLREISAEAFQVAHSRLFDHLCQTTEHRPDTLEGLLPLYQAVRHGCLAGRQQEAFVRVYVDRIYRGTGQGGFYSSWRLGAVGTNLEATTAFFEMPWRRLSPQLDEADQGWLINEAAFCLQSLGRVSEAREPMRAALDVHISAGDWINAARSADSLIEVEQSLGELAQAVATAREAQGFAEQITHPSWGTFQRTAISTTFANTLHNIGDRAKSRSLFEQAETMQHQRQPRLYQLYSLLGFQYVDLILAPTERAVWCSLIDRCAETAQIVYPFPDASTAGSALALDEAERRATQSLDWVLRGKMPLLDVALDHLTLARVTMYRAVLATPAPGASGTSADSSHLRSALDYLRQAGKVDFLPQALLTAALQHHALDHDPDTARRCLDEAQRIAARGPMPLYLADVHLHRARLFRDKAELEKVRALIQKHGYGRRREELADADAAARFW